MSGPPYQWQNGWRCPHCGLMRNGEGHDPCLGELPGVDYACCGHGGHGNGRGYIAFSNGVVIRFNQCDVEGNVGVTISERPSDETMR